MFNYREALILDIKELKKIAEWVVKKTNELIQYSTNLDNRGNDTRESPMGMWHRFLQKSAADTVKRNDSSGRIKQVYDWRIDLSSDSPREEFIDTFPLTFDLLRSSRNKEDRRGKFSETEQYLRGYEETVANAIKFNIGNCMEKSMLTLLLLREYEPSSDDLPKIEESISVKFVYLYPADKNQSHAFIVINLKMVPEGDAILQEPSTWNSDAVICDPWANEVYTIKEAMDSSEESLVWKNINNLKNDLGIEFAELQSYIGPAFNNNQPHSQEWIDRAERLTKNDPDNKWWKKSKSLQDLTRPPDEPESEELKNQLYPKK